MEGKKLRKIVKITFYNDVRIDDERIDVLTIELNDKKTIILDVCYGLTLDEADITKNAIKNTASNYKILYEYNEVDFQSDIDFNEVYKVVLHKRAVLVNTMRDTELKKSDYLEIIDGDGNNFFVDIVDNHIYKRVNLYKVVSAKNSITVFERYKCLKVKTWMFYSPFSSILSFFEDLE